MNHSRWPNHMTVHSMVHMIYTHDRWCNLKLGGRRRIKNWLNVTCCSVTQVSRRKMWKISYWKSYDKSANLSIHLPASLHGNDSLWRVQKCHCKYTRSAHSCSYSCSNQRCSSSLICRRWTSSSNFSFLDSSANLCRRDWPFPRLTFHMQPMWLVVSVECIFPYSCPCWGHAKNQQMLLPSEKREHKWI